MRTIVLGCGNVLLGDDGAGAWVLRQLGRAYQFPTDVSLVEGGALGLDLLGKVDGVDRLLVVAAIAAGRTPGSLGRCEGDEVSAALERKVSPHQMRPPDLLAGAERLSRRPRQIVLLSVEPARLEPGTGFSPAVELALPHLEAAVLDELARWAIEPLPLYDAPPPPTWWSRPAAEIAR